MKLIHFIACALFAAMLSVAQGEARAQGASWYGGIGVTATTLEFDVNFNREFSATSAGGQVFLGFEVPVGTGGVSLGGELDLEYSDSLEDLGNTIDILSAKMVGKVFVPLTSSGVVRFSAQSGFDFQYVEVNNGRGDTISYGLLGAGADVRLAPGVRLGYDFHYMIEDDITHYANTLRILYYF